MATTPPTTQNPWANYLGGLYGGSAHHLANLPNMGAQAADVGYYSQAGLRAASPQANIMGYGNLLSLLAGQGRTDPRMMNALLSQVQQNTQGAQMQQQGMAARQGMQNSGVNAALQAALGQAGTTRQSDLMAQDAQMAEARRRQDLQLFMDMILNPSRDYTAMALGQYNADQDRRAAEKASQNAMYGQLLGGLGSIFGLGG